jgi:hypothetical protein
MALLGLKLELDMDYRDAPYDDLCGCVAVILTEAECPRFDAAPSDHEKAHIEALLRAGKRQRHVLVNCKQCNGTGLASATLKYRLR